MIWIYGASGHGKVILDLLEEKKIAVAGFLDDNEALAEFMGYRVIRPDELTDAGAEMIIAVGDNATRKKIVEKNTYRYFTAIHPTAILSSHIAVAEGCVIMARAVVQTGTLIGKHTIINTGALVDHDGTIGDFVHVAPGVTLCGDVTIGECTWIGAGTTVIQGVTIGKNVFVGAGTLIRKDVPDNVLIVGNPQRIVRRFY
ncbi:MAG TPA: acetyltransferase [Bacteroidales bacterium]|nr:acetyltransferase [Bacteroidales bacterium]